MEIDQDDFISSAMKMNKRRGTDKVRKGAADAEFLPEIHENKSKSLWPGQTLSNFANMGDYKSDGKKK